MKQLIALLLSLILAAAVLPAAAETAVQPSEWSAGLQMEGFTVQEVRDFPLLSADLILLSHDRTGALALLVENEDTNRLFELTFRTPAGPDTGVSHVFEHATLDGSEKYPSKDLFFNLIYQTYNTYMNALTYNFMTTYPVASLSEAQLLKYADFYTDSCLHPMVYANEGIFREEAWRYVLPDADAPLTIAGTVYSEMLGAYNLEYASDVNFLRTMFPGSTTANLSGGLPARIPDLTWQDLKDYHDAWYHPSNSLAILYGKLEDPAAFLRMLDSYYSAYERKEIVIDDAGYQPITGAVERSFAHPAENGTPTDKASSAYYGFICEGADDQDTEVLDLLTTLLNSPSSPLGQLAHENLPSASITSYIMVESPEPAVVFSASHLDESEVPLFKETVDTAMRQVAEEGFSSALVDAVMSATQLSTKLIADQADIGVSIGPNLAYYWAATGNVFGYPETVDTQSQFRVFSDEGLYQRVASKYLVDQTRTALTVTSPVPGLKEEEDAKGADRLAQIKAAMSDEEIAAIVADTNAVAEPDDTSALVAQLQAVDVETLPEEMRLFDIKDETGEDGVRRITAEADVADLAQTVVLLDASHVPQDDLHWYTLFTNLLGSLDTSAHTRAEITDLTTRYMYGTEIRVSAQLRPEHTYAPYLRSGWIAASEDFEAGYALLHELLFDTQFTDAAKVLSQVTALKASLRQSINSAPYNTQLYRALAVSEPVYAYINELNQLSYYHFLEQTEALLSSDPDAALSKLQEIQASFNRRGGLILIGVGSPEALEANRKAGDAFAASLEDRPAEKQEYHFDTPASAEGLIVDTNVQFNLVYAPYSALEMDGLNGALRAVTSIVSDSLLYPKLRDQYGVYSVLHSASEEGIYIITYRDPNINESFAVYDQLPSLISGLQLDQNALNGYILSSYSGLAKPTGELSAALSSIMDTIQGYDPARKLTWMKELKAVSTEEVLRYADVYQKLMANGVRSTSGSASAISSHSGLYQAVINPFNTQDASQVELTDVPKEHPTYEAIRFVYENGLMAPAEGNRFGAEDPAAIGELAVALFKAVGGTDDAEAAVAFLVQYGILPDGTAPADPLDAASAGQILKSFSALAQLPWSSDAEDAAGSLTRGGLAALLYSLLGGMQ